MPTSEPILEFSDVALPAAADGGRGIDGIAFALRAGETAVVEAQPTRAPALADAAQGLSEPERGSIRFLGRAWPERGPDDAAAARARIGRTFQRGGWLANLDADENITLKERHHTARPAPDIEAEAVALASLFGLDDLPRARPAWLAPETLALGQWVRALLGAPALLLLEFPDSLANPTALAALRDAVRQRARNGAAALWIVANASFLSDPADGACARFRIEDGRWSARKEPCP